MVNVHNSSGIYAGYAATLVCLLLWIPAIDAESEQLSADAAHIEVRGLFKDSAVLDVNGKQILVKVGETAVGGIVLISADSTSAVIQYGGRQHQLNLSQNVASTYKRPEKVTVSILLNTQRQYVTTGSINGNPVRLLVDTGATLIAMNHKVARQLNIQYGNASPGIAVTAGGEVKSWQVILPVVQVGDIRRENVAAAVLEGDYPKDILLGMTFLQDVKMQESEGVLILSSEF